MPTIAKSHFDCCFSAFCESRDGHVSGVIGAVGSWPWAVHSLWCLFPSVRCGESAENLTPGFFPPSPWRTGNELSLAAAPSPVPALTEHAPVEAPRRNLMAATVQVGAFYECQVDGVDTIVKALSQIDDGTVLAERYVASRTGSGRVKVRKVKTCDAMLHVHLGGRVVQRESA